MAGEILVTGANGNVGSQLVKLFSKSGMEVRAVVKPGTSRELGNLPGVEVIEADLVKPSSLNFAFAGCKKICLILPLVSNMIDLTAVVCDCAKKAGIEYIVKLSGMFSETHKTKISELHRTTEEQIESSGIQYTFLKPNPFFQNYSNLCSETIRKKHVFNLPLGDTRMSMVDARDVSAVAYALLTSDPQFGESIEITGPESLSNEDVADAFTRILGVRVTYAAISDDIAATMMNKAGMSYWLTTALVELYQSQREGGGEMVSDAVQYFAKRDPISFETFVRDNLELFVDKPNVNAR
jgi:uncharacterized protein YbjT (DUF2867 family)